MEASLGLSLGLGQLLETELSSGRVTRMALLGGEGGWRPEEARPGLWSLPRGHQGQGLEQTWALGLLSWWQGREGSGGAVLGGRLPLLPSTMQGLSGHRCPAGTVAFGAQWVQGGRWTLGRIRRRLLRGERRGGRGRAGRKPEP